MRTCIYYIHIRVCLCIYVSIYVREDAQMHIHAHCNVGDVRSAGSVTMRRTERRSGAETWLDEAARRGGEAVRRHERLRRQPPSFDGGLFIGTKHALHRLLVSRDSHLSRPVSGRDRPCPRQYIITDLHLHTVRQREKEQRRAKYSIKQGTLSQSCKMERETEDTCHQQRRKQQRKEYIRNRERRRDEREKDREAHRKQQTKHSFPQVTEGRSGGRHLSLTTKETTEEGIHP